MKCGARDFLRDVRGLICRSQPSHSYSSVRGLHTQPPPLKVFNSITGKKELFEPQRPPYVSWYMCGPTVYDHTHIGHARTFVSFDVLRRIMESRYGLHVHQVWGMTDVDDKIIARAKEQGVTPAGLAHHFERLFWADMDALGVQRPAASTRVSDHIGEIVRFIERIIENGLAYVAPSGSVYFDSVAFGPSYGRFRAVSQAPPADETEESGAAEQTRGSQQTAAILGEKRHPNDFALWKGVEVEEQTEKSCCSWSDGGAVWESPWGVGRPGWHIECSAMATSHFGEGDLDVHTGGIDLQFPHHENEIAQCEAHHHGCGGKGWVKVWMHAGHLHIHGRKMSKSLKNFVSVRDFLGGSTSESSYTADHFRVFCLLHHYRGATTYSSDRMDDARALLQRFQSVAALRVREKESGSKEIGSQDGGMARVPAPEQYPAIGTKWGGAERRLSDAMVDAHSTVADALADDFDTRTAVLAVHGVAGHILQYVAQEPAPAAGLLEAAKSFVLGTTAEMGLSVGLNEKTAEHDTDELNQWIDHHAQFRSDVRGLAMDTSIWADASKEQKNIRNRLFGLCDSARESTEAMGVVLRDSTSGKATWSRKV